MGKSKFISKVAVVQGFFYLATGVWPIFSSKSFQKVTGPKRDLWLVKTIGVLVSIVGAVLVFSGLRNRVPTEARLMAAGTALGLGGSDVVYSVNGTVSKVYLLDAISEALLVCLWLLGWMIEKQG